MEVRELRIGNWVNNGFGKPFQIIGIISEGNTGGYKLSTLKPIPITPEILEKFGFDLESDDGDIKYFQPKGDTGYGVCFDHDDISFYKFEKKWSANVITTIIYAQKHFAYLHQLQNLYFSLTGQELEIKLK